MSDYDIAEAFQRIEEQLIASMRRNMAHHRALETSEGLNYTQWQAEQLRALQEFRLKNEKLFSEYYSTINEQIEAGLADTYRFGRMSQERAILTALKNGARLPRKPTAALQQSFFRLNERKMNALIRSVTNDMKRAETAVLRFCDDQYRKVIFNSQVYFNSGAGTLEQSIDMATKDFLSQGISCIQYRNGARVPIDAYAKMALRTANTRAYLMGEASMRDEWGISTVIVNKRGVACPKCLQYVGRVFYDDVYGSAPIPKEGKYPLLSSAIAGGLYHPNCKDIHTTYFEGISTPPSPPDEAQRAEAERVYKLEQEQRYNERHIRKYKRLRDGSLDEDNRREYAGKLAGWEKRQKDFIEQHGDVLRRRRENEVTRGIQVAEPPSLKTSGKPPARWQARNAEAIARVSVAETPELQRDMLADAVESGDYTPKLRVQKQNEHIQGTPEFDRRRRDRERQQQAPQSVFYAGTDVETLVKAHIEKGSVQAGSGVIREFVTVDTPVGMVYNVGTGEMQPTTRFVIEYGRKGIHAFPVKDW